MFENYQYISDNNLDLNAFVKEYKESSKSKITENNEEIILETEVGEGKNKILKKLYLDKKTNLPKKLEIKYVKKKNSIYILYREVEIKNYIYNLIFFTLTNI